MEVATLSSMGWKPRLKKRRSESNSQGDSHAVPRHEVTGECEGEKT